MSKLELLRNAKHYFASNKNVARLSAVLTSLVIVQLAILTTPSLTGSVSEQEVWKTDMELQKTQTTLVQGVAKRLQRRLATQNDGHLFDLGALEHAVRQRQVLLKRRTTIEIARSNGDVEEEYIHLYYHPLWIKAEFNESVQQFVLNDDVIHQWIEENVIQDLVPPEHATLTKINYPEVEEELEEGATIDDMDRGLVRVETEGVAKEGEVFDKEAGLLAITDGLYGKSETITLQIETESGRIENATEIDLGDLVLLSSGESNYYGSTWGRMMNVRKALREHVNNVLVAPGETFSFNETLGGPITLSRGWAMGKIIVEGSKLQAAAGGGICQASTTMYRAILNSGFKTEERKAHSMYISYYEKYGVGIDATIFPGYQDLTFINDTANHILIQSYYDGYEATVNIYGTPDGRSVELAGPYFEEDQPGIIANSDNPLDKREIGWIQTINYADGSQHNEIIRSRYSILPRYIVHKYMEREKISIEILHASAQ